jgi:ABC-2 type transport system permease protein
MQRILYLIQKEFRQVFRDRAMLAIMLIAPVIQTVILGFAMTTDVKNVKLVIYDADNSSVSRDLARRFIHNPNFRFVGYVESPAAMHRTLDNWQAQIGIFIEPGFARHLQRNLAPGVQIVVDGLDGNSAGIATGYAQGILGEFAQEIIVAPSAATPVIGASRMWYNLDLNSKHYMVPGIIAVLLTVITMFLTSMGLVREKEIGTLEQLMVTPIRPAELIIGKVLPFLLIGLVAVNVTLAVAFPATTS